MSNKKKSTKNSKPKFFIETDIRDILLSDEEGDTEYEKEIERVTSLIENDITKRTLKCKIRFTDNIEKEITLGNYLTYLIIYLPFFYFNTELEDADYFDVRDINNLESYFDKVIKKFQIDNDENDDVDIVGEILIEIINKLNHINCVITHNFGPTISLKEMIDIADRNPEFAKILYEPELDVSNMTATDITNHTAQISKKVEQIICDDEENTFKYFIKSGSGVNMKQFGQMVGYIGLKPDLKEKIIPRPVNTNFCIGLQTASHFYINAEGCLKALIVSHIQVKNSGYFTRKLEILLNDEFLNNEQEDCGTKHLLPLEIKIKYDENGQPNKNSWKTYFKRLKYRYFSESPSGKNLQKIEEDVDYSKYNGKTIYLRDPVTCACKKGICKKCYGDLSKINYSYNIGIIACLIMTNAFTQTMLSTKHLLQAKTFNKTYSDAFNKFLEFDIDKVVIRDEYINKISIEIEGLDSNEESDNKEYIFNQFTIIYGDERYQIDEDTAWILNDEINDLVEKSFDKEREVYVLKGKNLKDFEYIFSHIIDNNGLSRTMLLVQNLIDTNYFINDHNFYELYEKFVELMNESSSKMDYVHISVIVKNMMKIIGGDRTLFKLKEEPEVQLYKISDAIQYNSESVSAPLLFEQIKKQLTTDKYGTMTKCGKSNYDILLK